MFGFGIEALAALSGAILAITFGFGGASSLLGVHATPVNMTAADRAAGIRSVLFIVNREARSP
jgi:hypothetical protein